MNTLKPIREFAIGFALLAVFAAPPASAQEATYELDPAATQVTFALGDVLHTVRGTFKLKRGTVKFDAASGRAEGLVVVDATSGDSGSHARDRKMHKEVLESAQYPEITFAPEKIEGQVAAQGDFQVQVPGTFTIHGAGHALTLVVRAHLAGDRLTVDTNFSVPYESWGMRNPSTLFLHVSDTVEIAIHAAGQFNLAASP